MEEKFILNNIKSNYIIKFIFSLLRKRRQLYLITYNKNLQNRIEVNIEDYKKESGICVEGGRNGKVKIYTLNTNKLIYEGDFLNGKKNGIGKDYWNGKLEYEGGYLNGLKNGQGKYYDIFQFGKQLLYEGEYLNDKKHGKGIEYESDRRYEGEFSNGEKNGKIKEYFKNELIFEGEYLNGVRWNGIWKGEGKFGGEILNGKKWNGKFKEYYVNNFFKYEGEYLNGKRHGEGKEYDNRGKLIFEGIYENGERKERKELKAGKEGKGYESVFNKFCEIISEKK